jgi:hypothetical protein
MRVFAIGIEHALDVAIERPHEAGSAADHKQKPSVFVFE